MEPVPTARRYSDREVALILERATQLQRAGPGESPRDGLTLAELEEIAAEAGIDPGTLRVAARELDVGGSGGLLQRVAGGPLLLSMERIVPGSLPRASLDALVPMIQRAADAPGQASAVGGTLTWSSNAHGNTRSLQVLVGAEREDHTLVRVEERLGGLAGALYGGVVGGVGGGVGFGVGGAVGGALGSVLFGTLIPVAALGASYFVARGFFRAAVARRARALSGLVEGIAREIETRSGPGSGGRLAPGPDGAPVQTEPGTPSIPPAPTSLDS